MNARGHEIERERLSYSRQTIKRKELLHWKMHRGRWHHLKWNPFFFLLLLWRPENLSGNPPLSFTCSPLNKCVTYFRISVSHVKTSFSTCVDERTIYPRFHLSFLLMTSFVSLLRLSTFARLERIFFSVWLMCEHISEKCRALVRHVILDREAEPTARGFRQPLIPHRFHGFVCNTNILETLIVS